MTVEDIKKEIERMQDVTKDIKVSVGNLRSDINQLEGAIKQDNDEFEARLAEAESRGAQKGYEKGFAEGRTRKKLSDAQGDDYQRGCKDAWNMAKRIELDPKDYKDGIPIDKINEVFGTPFAYRVFQEYSYQEVVSKLNAPVVDPEGEIYVGDIVQHKLNSGLEVYVFQVDKHLNMLTGMALYDSAGFSRGGAVCSELDNFVKTGRHHDFNSILEFLKS